MRGESYSNSDGERVFFVSDTHFGHKNIIGYCDRPFTSVPEMDAGLISNWNSVVGNGDAVYILGDFSFSKGPRTLEVLGSLNGEKHLVLGNHDAELRSEYESTSVLASVNDYLEIKIGTNLLCLFHFPMMDWNHRYKGSYNLHGHKHSKLPRQLGSSAKQVDVGVDANNYSPTSWSAIQAMFAGENLIVSHE